MDDETVVFLKQILSEIMKIYIFGAKQILSEIMKIYIFGALSSLDHLVYSFFCLQIHFGSNYLLWPENPYK